MTTLTADTSDLVRLSGVLKAYQRASGKAWPDIMQKEGRETAWALSNAFRAISPERSVITAKAKSLAGKLKRAPNELTPAGNGVSDAAFTRAVRFLEGDKSGFFRVSTGAEGVPIVKKAKVSGARKSNKLLLGGKSGHRFAPSALSLARVSAARRKAVFNDAFNRGIFDTIKRLNLRALSVVFEIQNRVKAAAGHLLALQFLPKVFQRRQSSWNKGGPLIVRSTKNVPLGVVEYVASGDQIGVSITGLVPGTAKQASRHGILPRVFAARIEDRMVYIRRKLDEAGKEAQS